MEVELSKTLKVKLLSNPNYHNYECILLPCSSSLCGKITDNAKISLLEDLNVTDRIKSLIEKDEFTGKVGQIVRAQASNKSGNIVFICVFGTSSNDKTVDPSLSACNFRSGGLSYASVPSMCTEVLLSCPYINNKPTFSDEEMSGFASGLADASYYFSRYITDKKRLKKIGNLTSVVVQSCGDGDVNNHMINEVNNVNYSVSMAKDLVNYPPNDLFPVSYANFIEKHFRSLKNTTVKVYNAEELKKMGLAMLLAVGQGSRNKPLVVIIEYKGNASSNEYSVGLVGKGITFDSGGLSIKPSRAMVDMKTDMGGSAAVIGAMMSLILNNVKANVVGIVALVENSVGDNAQRPGDVVKSLCGKTVEVLNTDAEGRLVLGDIMSLVQREYKMPNIIDIATLTGAVTVALGSFYAGLFSNSDHLAELLTASGAQTGEKVYKLPMGTEYSALIKSPIADIKNISNTGLAGSTTAAEFLKHFVEEKTKWAHIDIAGTAYLENSYPLSHKKYATGFGVKLLYDTVKRLAS
ncbi:MAG: leucyl aminopeptidase family protein [Alphaproteobacteria bacterium]|nr:leucyl aminopeptidase family protein [Rickettsiales bacterium]